MRISIQQPEFIPWAGFFNKILETDKTVILDSVQFKKRYFENRCRIQLNDKVQWLTVPVITKGRYHQTIADVEVDNDSAWGAKALGTLRQAYRGSPFWGDHEDFLVETFQDRKWGRLLDLNLNIIVYISQYLSIRFEHCLASEYNLASTGSDLILDLCKRTKTSEYLSGEAGRDYLDNKTFADAGIEIVYQDFTPLPYVPFQGIYQGPLGMFEALCSQGPNAIQHVGGS